MVRFLDCLLEPIKSCFPFIRGVGVVAAEGGGEGGEETVGAEDQFQVEGVLNVTAPSLPPITGLRMSGFMGTINHLPLASSPPRSPRSIDRVESGLRESDQPVLPAIPFWTPEEATVLRAAGIYSPLPIPVSEMYPVLGSCDRCLNQYESLYQRMIESGVPQTCPCGIPLPHEVIYLQRFGRL